MLLGLGLMIVEAKQGLCRRRDVADYFRQSKQDAAAQSVTDVCLPKAQGRFHGIARSFDKIQQVQQVFAVRGR
jgi:hypothetical protein